jgi:hypothetical protein
MKKILTFLTLFFASANAFALDYRINLINNTSENIDRFYASNVGTDSWEEDILGVSILRPGRYVTINLYDGTGMCRFDFKTVMEDGQVLIRRNVNVCGITDYTISE